MPSDDRTGCLDEITNSQLRQVGSQGALRWRSNGWA